MYHFHQCWDERKQELGQKREKDAVFGFWRLNVKGLWTFQYPVGINSHK